MYNYKQLPLQVLEDYLALKNLCRQIAKKFESVVSLEFDSDTLAIIFKDADPNHDYSFVISNPRLQKSTKNYTAVTINFSPKSPINTQNHSVDTATSQVEPIIEKWINYILRYNQNILADRMYQREQEYASEYYKDLKPGGDEDNFTPFKTAEQIIIIRLLITLENAIEGVESEGQETQDLLAETDNLKNTIHVLSKNQARKKLALIISKTRMKGFKFFNSVWTVVKTEAPKWGVKNMLDWLLDFIKDNIQRNPPANYIFDSVEK